jgi:hypothetical protein
VSRLRDGCCPSTAAASIPPAGVTGRPLATTVATIPPAARARAWEAAASKELNPASKEIICVASSAGGDSPPSMEGAAWGGVEDKGGGEQKDERRRRAEETAVSDEREACIG